MERKNQSYNDPYKLTWGRAICPHTIFQAKENVNVT
jgi:hypothetical protein